MKYLVLILLVGCGSEVIPQDEAELLKPTFNYVDPVQVTNKCIFEREICEKTYPVRVCEQAQKKCMEQK